MSDMSQVIAPKSDQLNADDLIAGDMTITITGVNVTPGTEQPVSISFQGSSKFYRPCKSMSRVMVACWGPDAKAYTGRSLTLYRDPKVKWGGMEVGGIRIRAMSHIDRDQTMMLSESKANRKPHKVSVLKPAAQPAAPIDAPTLTATDAVTLAETAARKGSDHFRAWFNTDEGKACRATGALDPDRMAALKGICLQADTPVEELDAFGLPPIVNPATATDAEIAATLEREHAAYLTEQARQAAE